MKVWFCFVAALIQLAWGAVLSKPPAEPPRPAPPPAQEPAWPLDAYVPEAYLQPIWEGGVVYHESVMPLEGPDGSMGDIALLYEASEIISVRSSDLRTEYVPGVDYALADGKLRLLDGAIPRVPFGRMYPPEEIEVPGGGLLFPGKDVPWIYIEGGSLFHTWQLAVTYKHTDAFPGAVPPRQGGRLPNTLAKLEAGAPLRLLVYGDSLAVGCQSSGWDATNVPPYAPTFFDMFAGALRAQYGGEITVVNTAVGGVNSAWAADNAQELAAEQSPDLMIVSLGGNDAPGKVPPATFAWNVLRLFAKVKAQNPQCEFILLAPALQSPHSFHDNGYQLRYRPWALGLGQEGVAVLDMAQMYADLLARKRFEDIASNNINHPNDFTARIYAQMLLETLKGDFN